MVHIPRARARPLAIQCRAGGQEMGSLATQPLSSASLYRGKRSRGLGSQLATSDFLLVWWHGSLAQVTHTFSRRMKESDHYPRSIPRWDPETGVCSNVIGEVRFLLTKHFHTYFLIESSQLLWGGLTTFISQRRGPRLSSQVVCPNSHSGGSTYSHRQILEIVVAAQCRRSSTKIFSGEVRGVGRAETGDVAYGPSRHCSLNGGLVTLSNVCHEF